MMMAKPFFLLFLILLVIGGVVAWQKGGKAGKWILVILGIFLVLLLVPHYFARRSSVEQSPETFDPPPREVRPGWYANLAREYEADVYPSQEAALRALGWRMETPIQKIRQYQSSQGHPQKTFLTLVRNEIEPEYLDAFRAGIEERTGAIITEGYGLTEATALVTSNPIDAERKAGSVGVPIRCEVRVVDKEGNDVPVEDVGEIIIRGKNVMNGYYNNPEGTLDALKNGWLHTGDMGKYDSDGYLYVVDRKKDMIITGGYNIYPAEVENALYKNSKIAMATVIGVPHEIKGEIAKAYVVLKEGETATEQEIIDFCRDRIAKYKAPRAVEFRNSLPTTPTGKILKRALRDEVLAAETNNPERR